MRSPGVRAWPRPRSTGIGPRVKRSCWTHAHKLARVLTSRTPGASRRTFAPLRSGWSSSYWLGPTPLSSCRSWTRRSAIRTLRRSSLRRRSSWWRRFAPYWRERAAEASSAGYRSRTTWLRSSWDRCSTDVCFRTNLYPKDSSDWLSKTWSARPARPGMPHHMAEGVNPRRIGCHGQGAAEQAHRLVSLVKVADKHCIRHAALATSRKEVARDAVVHKSDVNASLRLPSPSAMNEL